MPDSSVSLAVTSSDSHLHACSALLDIPGMRDPLVVALTRLIEREGGRTTVADEIKSSDQTLYQIVRGVKDSKTGTPKGVGPSLRKRLDERYPGWRLLGESPHNAGHIAPPKQASTHSSENLPLMADLSAGNTFRHAPVVAWASLGEVLNRDNDEWPIEAMREIHTTKSISRKTKWVEVQDDLLAPKVLKGDMVAIDPEGAAPKMDGLVLALAADGSHMLRFWRPLAGGAFEVFDGAGRTMDSIRHGITIAGVFVTLQRDTL